MPEPTEEPTPSGEPAPAFGPAGGRPWAAIAFIAALALIAWRNWVLAPSDHGLATADWVRYLNWIHTYVRDRVLSGHLPLWNPYNYAGQPFAANPQVALFYPPTWLALVLPLPIAQRAMIVLHVALAGAFMYLLLRRLEVSTLPALAGALPWMLGSYLAANAVVGHLSMVCTATWLPLVLWCYEGALRRGRLAYYAAAGAVLGIQVLAGEPQNSYYSAVAVTAWALARHGVRDGPRSIARRGLPGLVVAGTVALLVAAVQFVPTVEMMLHSDRRVPSYVFATVASFEPATALGFILPWSSSIRYVVDGEGRPVVNLGWEHATYVGILTLVLAAAARRRHSDSVLPAQVLLVLGVVLALGGYTPLYRVFFVALPGLSLFRVPSRALLMVVLALSVLCAHGLQALLARPPTRRWRWTVVALLLLAAGAWTAVLADGLPVLRGDTFDRVPGVIRGRFETLTLTERAGLQPLVMLVLAAAWVAVAPRLRPAALGQAAVALLAIDLLAAQPDLLLGSAKEQAEQQVRRLQSLRDHAGDGEPFRVDIAPGHLVALAATAARVDNVNGYWPVALRRFYRYVHASRGVPPDAHTRHQVHDVSYGTPRPFGVPLLNVRFVSAIQPGSRPGREKFSLLSANQWMPRAWVVDRAEVVVGEEQTLERLRDPAFDPRLTVLLESEPLLPLAGSGVPPGTARARRVDDAVLEVETDTRREGYLVLSEVHYPGWRATVDGAPVAVQRADYVLAAVPLPAGRHRVRYEYRPPSVLLGATLSGITLLGLGALAVRSARRRRAAEYDGSTRRR